MRRRALRKLLARLAQLQAMELKRDQLLLKIGAAKAAAGRAYYLVDIRLPAAREPVNAPTFSFKLNRARLRVARRREGRYLLRSNLCEELPVKLWELYMQLTQVEEAFKNLKGDLAIRPIYPQREARIEAHIFIAFLAYCLQVTLTRRLRDLAPGLSRALRAGEVRRRANDRCAAADERRPQGHLLALHAARRRAQAPAAPAETRASRPSAAADHRRRPALPRKRSVVQTF